MISEKRMKEYAIKSEKIDTVYYKFKETLKSTRFYAKDEDNRKRLQIQMSVMRNIALVQLEQIYNK
jgi:hypothetical protein